jgi:predicted GNAT family N-acyltransferase
MGTSRRFSGEEGQTGLHGPFRACEVRDGERVTAEVCWRSEGVSRVEGARIWRISPLGIELLVGGENGSPGSAVELILKLGDQHKEHYRLTVESVRPERHGRILSMAWMPSANASREARERRRVKRWLCGGPFALTGIAPNPLRFHDFIYFRVEELSHGGVQFFSSLRNNLLLPGLRLDAVLTFPGLGASEFRLRLVHTRIVDDAGVQRLRVGAQWLNPTRTGLGMAAQYLHQFGPRVTPSELGAAGLPIRSASLAVSFSDVRNEEDYRQVLALRKRAYQTAGKLGVAAQDVDTADSFDDRARIIIARHQGEVVGSMRLMFHQAADPTEHEQYFPWPSDFPPREQCIEVTRVCTHPAFRGSDLLYALFRHGLFVAASSGRRYVLGSSTSKLLKVYRRLGFQLTDLRYRHEALGGEEHRLFIGDLHGALKGKAVNPVLWNSLYADVWDYVEHRHLPELRAFDACRLRMYRLLEPLTRPLARRLARPGRRSPR